MTPRRRAPGPLRPSITWVGSDGGVWRVTPGQFEELWSNADEETKRVNDEARFERENGS